MPQPGDQVSLHQVIIYAYLRQKGTWTTHHQIAQATTVNPRTLRLHTRRLVAQGLVERITAYPGYRYRALPEDQIADSKFLQRIKAVAEAIDLPLDQTSITEP